MKKITLLAFLFFCFICAPGQNLIGYNGREITNYMKENRKEMSFNSVNNSKFKYLKYSDSRDSKTILFFLNNDSVCHSVRLICDINSKAEMIKECNTVYTKIGDNRWIDVRGGRNYLIQFKDEDWSCVITIDPEK